MVPTELNQMPHTGGDAITRAGIARAASEGKLFAKSTAAVGAAFAILAPNTVKAKGFRETGASVAIDLLDTLDPGVQDIYSILMWGVRKGTGLDVETKLLEDFHDEVLK